MIKVKDTKEMQMPRAGGSMIILKVVRKEILLPIRLLSYTRRMRGYDVRNR